MLVLGASRGAGGGRVGSRQRLAELVLPLAAHTFAHFAACCADLSSACSSAEAKQRGPLSTWRRRRWRSCERCPAPTPAQPAQQPGEQRAQQGASGSMADEAKERALEEYRRKLLQHKVSPPVDATCAVPRATGHDGLWRPEALEQEPGSRGSGDHCYCCWGRCCWCRCRCCGCCCCCCCGRAVGTEHLTNTCRSRSSSRARAALPAGLSLPAAPCPTVLTCPPALLPSPCRSWMPRCGGYGRR